MPSPTDRRYSESHEWFQLDGAVVTIGLTKFAVDELTDITYVEMKDAGTTVNVGDVVGEVESVKATSDVYAAIPGEIVETNAALSDDPSLINTDPYDAGWLVKIRTTDPSALDALMDQPTYDQKHPVG